MFPACIQLFLHLSVTFVVFPPYISESLLLTLIELYRKVHLVNSVCLCLYVVADPGCGGTYTESQGIIISPNWPNNYAHNKQCIYLIRLPRSEQVALNFTHMELELHNGCEFDYVEVFCVRVRVEIVRQTDRVGVAGSIRIAHNNDALTEKCTSCLRCVMAQGKQLHFLESTVVAHYLPPSCHRLMPFGFVSNRTALSTMLALGLFMKSVRLVFIPLRL